MIDKSNWPKPGEMWTMRDGSVHAVGENEAGLLCVSKGGQSLTFSPSGSFMFSVDYAHEYDLVKKLVPLPEPVERFVVVKDGRVASTASAREELTYYGKDSGYRLYRAKIVFEEEITDGN